MNRKWKRKGNPSDRPALFCPKCGRCMYTKDDVRSRDERGFCAKCSDATTSSEYQVDVITIVLSEPA